VGEDSGWLKLVRIPPVLLHFATSEAGSHFGSM
jgi:hypothetical protein